MSFHRAVATMLAAFVLTIPTSAAGQSLADASPVFEDLTLSSPTPVRIAAATRPLALPAMYVSCATLQAYDAYSTLKGIQQGAVEANPIARGIVGRPIAFVAVKGAVTFGTIYAAERLWRRHHRAGAIALMAVTNGLMVGVAAQNASVLRAQR